MTLLKIAKANLAFVGLLLSSTAVSQEIDLATAIREDSLAFKAAEAECNLSYKSNDSDYLKGIAIKYKLNERQELLLLRFCMMWAHGVMDGAKLGKM